VSRKQAMRGEGGDAMTTNDAVAAIVAAGVLRRRHVEPNASCIEKR